MPTFTVIPSFAPTSRRRPRVLSTKFGDGYEQRGLDGIHPDLQSWSLTFSERTDADADTIEGFFVTNNTGVTPFDWTSPSGAAGKYLCREWTRTLVYFDGHTITATFEEVPDP